MVGNRPGRRRPCLAIQPPEFGEGGLESSVVLPLTTRLAAAGAFPLRVRIPAGTCGLKYDSDIMVDQVLAWDNSLFLQDLGEVPEAVQEEVRRALLEFLDLAG